METYEVRIRVADKIYTCILDALSLAELQNGGSIPPDLMENMQRSNNFEPYIDTYENIVEIMSTKMNDSGNQFGAVASTPESAGRASAPIGTTITRRDEQPMDQTIPLQQEGQEGF